MIVFQSICVFFVLSIDGFIRLYPQKNPTKTRTLLHTSKCGYYYVDCTLRKLQLVHRVETEPSKKRGCSITFLAFLDEFSFFF